MSIREINAELVSQEDPSHPILTGQNVLCLASIVSLVGNLHSMSRPPQFNSSSSRMLNHAQASYLTQTTLVNISMMSSRFNASAIKVSNIILESHLDRNEPNPRPKMNESVRINVFARIHTTSIQHKIEFQDSE
jgi:hypothetical protein